jgi:type I restriction enzyme S subunit
MKADWPLKTLGEILTERQQKPSIDAILAGKVPIVSKIGFYDGTIELRDNFNTKTGMIQIEPGDLVLSGINAAKGAIAIYDEKKPGPIAATIHYASYITNKDKIDIRYLWWFLRSNEFREILNRNVPGGIKTELKAKRFLPIPIPLPPLSEQQRIVTKIEQLASKIEEAYYLRCRAIQEAAALRKGVVKEYFKQLCLKYNKLDTLGNIAQIVGGSSIPEIVGPSPEDPDVFFVKVSDMNSPGNETIISTRAAGANYGSSCLNRARIIPENAIIFPKRGGAIATNKRRLLGRPAILDPNLMAVYPKEPQRLSPLYLFKWLETLDLAELQNGTSVPQINKGDLAPLEIPVPGIDEQRLVVNHLDEVQAKLDNVETLQNRAGIELDALLPSILDKAFKGEF